MRFDAATGVLTVLDQTRLPFEVVYLQARSVADCVRLIRDMHVRGAPLIGLVAAAGMAIAARSDASDPALAGAAAQLLASRPTAVNLRWALQAMMQGLSGVGPGDRAHRAGALLSGLERKEYHCCERIAEHGYGLLQQRAQQCAGRAPLQVLTHCNAGWLATGAWGTALAPLYRAALEGLPLHVWVDETRPRNQGARLTAWELQQAGIDHTIIVDNCAGHLMQRGMVDLCIVGSDRTTRSGDVCNKIGTYQKALAAADNGIPFYVALPSSTIDWELDAGAGIEIEARDPLEVLRQDGQCADGELASLRMANPGSRALNYAFDVTPARLVTALVSEHGVHRADSASLAQLQAVLQGDDAEDRFVGAQPL
jgi:methylthioribose-1-phosphate isomerase